MYKRRLSIYALVLLLMPTFLLGTVHSQDSAKNYIPASAMMAVVARPSAALAHPSFELFPREIVSAMVPKEFGFDPCLMTRLTLAVDTLEGPGQPPMFGAVMEFEVPQKIGGKLIETMDKHQLGAFPAYTDGWNTIAQLDEKTIAFGNEQFLVKMFNAQGAKSELISLIENDLQNNHLGVFMVMEPIRGLLKQNLPPAEQIPPVFRDFLKIPDLTESLVLSADLNAEQPLEFRLNAISPEAATEMNRIVINGMDMGQQLALMQISEALKDQDPDLQRSSIAYMQRVFTFLKKHISPEISQDGQSLVFSANVNASSQIATIGILTGMLLPAVQQVREAARRTTSANNLRQFALAALNYESAYGEFPAHASYSDDGKPLLSWRVAILPYIEQGALYDQFHLDEPWDSPHNIKLLDQMPEIYSCPNSVHTNKTVYQALVGKGTAMNGTKEAVSISDIRDGTSNTILFVETDDDFAQPWTKPADLNFDPDNPKNGLGNMRAGGFQAAFCDGSVQFVPNTIGGEMMKFLALINDGQVPRF